MSERGWAGWLRYGVPGLVLGLIVSWGAGVRGPSALAQGAGSAIPMPNAAADRGRAPALPLATGEASGTIALTTPAGGGGSGQFLYLIDTKAKAFAVYRVDPAAGKGAVKLEAARQYQWDLKLTEYNNQPPEVTAIESTVRSLGQPTNR